MYIYIYTTVYDVHFTYIVKSLNSNFTYKPLVSSAISRYSRYPSAINTPLSYAPIAFGYLRSALITVITPPRDLDTRAFPDVPYSDQYNDL